MVKVEGQVLVRVGRKDVRWWYEGFLRSPHFVKTHHSRSRVLLWKTAALSIKIFKEEKNTFNVATNFASMLSAKNMSH